MTTLRQAAQQALDAYESANLDMHIAAIHALRTALEQQAEPVGEVIDERGEVDYISYVPPVGTNLYTTPPQRKPLSEKQVHKIWRSLAEGEGIDEFARALEAAHGIGEKK